MGPILDAINDTPVPNLLIVFGGAPMFLAFVGRFGTYVELPLSRQKTAGAVGGALLLAGIAITIIPVLHLPPSSDPLTGPAPAPTPAAGPHVQERRDGGGTPDDAGAAEETAGQAGETGVEVGAGGDLAGVRLNALFPELAENGSSAAYQGITRVTEADITDDAYLAIVRNHDFANLVQKFGGSGCFAGSYWNDVPKFDNFLVHLDSAPSMQALFDYFKQKARDDDQVLSIDEARICGEQSYLYKTTVASCGDAGINWVQVCRSGRLLYGSSTFGGPHLDDRAKAFARKMVAAMERKIRAAVGD
jgi:hypothetical protein